MACGAEDRHVCMCACSVGFLGGGIKKTLSPIEYWDKNLFHV
jgi:hypothetical protein